MRHFSIMVLVALMLPWTTAQSAERSSEAANTVTYVVLRHAEKATDDPDDPALSEAGLERAKMIASALSSRNVSAVYSSDYRRTRETAAASAEQAGLKTMLYNPAESAEQFVEQLEAEHHSGLVLIVGHSNTVPALVAALCRCAIDAIDESDYGNWFEVSIDGDQRTLLKQTY